MLFKGNNLPLLEARCQPVTACQVSEFVANAAAKMHQFLTKLI